MKGDQQQFGPGETLQGILHSDTGLLPGGTTALTSSEVDVPVAHPAIAIE